MSEQTSNLTDRDIVALVFAHAGLVAPDFQADSFYHHVQQAYKMADVFLEEKDKK